MCCSTCDGYEFVPNPEDPEGEKLDCPDCRAIDERPLVWCPTHSIRVELDGRCRKCCLEATNAEEILFARARLAAETPRERMAARDMVTRTRLATSAEEVAA